MSHSTSSGQDEERVLYTDRSECATLGVADIYVKRSLSTRNLDEIERELDELERKLVPFLNRVRAIRGKRPVIVPEG